MDEVFTLRQAAIRLGIPYKRVYYASLRYGTRQYKRHTTRLVTLTQVEAALSQVKPSARRASA